MATTGQVLRVDISDPQAMISFADKATADWPRSRREALCDDLMAALDGGDALDLQMGAKGFEVTANQRFFDVFREYGLLDAAVM